jgi:hypothetical protein
MRTWLLLGCLVAGITLCIRTPLPAVRRRPVRSAPRRDSARCLIEGRTVHSVTGQPLANVRVLLDDSNPQRPRRSTAIADASGHFRFRDLEPGEYHLEAQQAGYPPLVHVSDSASAKEGTISLKAGQRVRDLEIRLTPAATIAGTVIDLRNRTVARARVGIEETRREGGTLRVVEADGRGRFRIGLLPPGRYRITAELDAEATPPSSTPDNGEGLGGRVLTVRNHAEATPAVVVVVEVEAGEELSDVQVLIPAPDRKVRLALT